MQVLDSLVEGMALLPDDADQQSYAWALLTYLSTGEVPEGLTPVAYAMLTANRPVLDNSRTRAKAGAAGGRKSPRKGADGRTGDALSRADECDAGDAAEPGADACPADGYRDTAPEQASQANGKQTASKREANRQAKPLFFDKRRGRGRGR